MKSATSVTRRHYSGQSLIMKGRGNDWKENLKNVLRYMKVYLRDL